MANIIVTVDREMCKGCGLCVSVCPKHVLEIEKEAVNKKGYYPAVPARLNDCIGCISCARMCPETAIRLSLIHI